LKKSHYHEWLQIRTKKEHPRFAICWRKLRALLLAPVRETSAYNARNAQMTQETRKVRSDITAEQLAKLQEFGAIDFKSAGATRKTSK